MLTRSLIAFVLISGLAAAFGLGLPMLWPTSAKSAATEQQAKLLALGLTDHEVTPEELEKGTPLPVPRFNTPAMAYVWAANVKKGDSVEITLNNGDTPLLRNTETLAEDKVSFLLQAGKRGVPAGGWPEGTYHAEVKITRDGKPVISESTKPIAFE